MQVDYLCNSQSSQVDEQIQSLVQEEDKFKPNSKTKTIKKKYQKSSVNKQRKSSPKRNSSNVRLGRPKYQLQNEVFQTEQSPQIKLKYQIQLIFIKYLKQIGIKKGLVFDKDVRKQLKKMQQKNNAKVPQIQWFQRHSWNQMIEKQKVRNILQTYKICQTRKQTLQWYFVEIGEIFTSETTQEIYNFLIKIILNIQLQLNDEEKKLNRKNIYIQMMKNGKFLNQKFTTKGIKHKIQKKSHQVIGQNLLKLIQQLQPKLLQI